MQSRTYGPCVATPARNSTLPYPRGCRREDNETVIAALALDASDSTVAVPSVKECGIRKMPYPQVCNCAHCRVGFAATIQPQALAYPVAEICARYPGPCRGGCGHYVEFQDTICKATQTSSFTCRQCANATILREDLETIILEFTRKQNTQEQIDILRWLQYGKPGTSLLIDAKAGSGKTTTICQGYALAKKLNPKCKCLFIAFNRSIVEELRIKGMPSHTAHGIGWKAWLRAHSDWNTAGCAVQPEVEESTESDDDCDGDHGAESKESTHEANVDRQISGQEHRYLTSSKTAGILTKLYPPSLEEKTAGKKYGLTKRLARFIGRLVALAKNNCFGVPGCTDAENLQNWLLLAQLYNLREILINREEYQQTQADIEEDMVRGCEIAKEVLSVSVELAKTAPRAGGVLDFDDQLYMPLQCGLTLGCDEGYDIIFVDEAQDMNRARIEIVRRLVRDDGASRIVAVGDPFQAIYAFTGAEHDALYTLGRNFMAETLPLSMTWRCPSSHVELANGMMKRWGRLQDSVGMQARDDADVGIIAGRWWTWAQVGSEEVTFANYPLSGTRDCAILCRTNAPLLLLYYKLVARGIPCELRGKKALRAELLALLNAATSSVTNSSWTTAALEQCMDRHLEGIKRRAQLSSSKLQQNEDLADCLKICMEQVKGRFVGDALASLHSEIYRVFGPGASKPLIALSTIHKAKGLEWHTVYILQPFSLPMPFIIGPDLGEAAHGWDWEQKQEQNVAYVAVTRAKSELLFLKHLKNLKDDRQKIVELFGEEDCGNADHEQWWDEEYRKGGSFGTKAENCVGLNVGTAAKLLGVKLGASAAEVNAAFKKLAIVWHPDKARGEERSKTASIVFPRMLAARELLLK